MSTEPSLHADGRLAVYQGRRVLVLGGLGFIGSALTRTLLDLRAAVTVLSRQRAANASLAALFESRGAVLVEADVLDLQAMKHVVQGQDAVFHLAGRSGAVDSVHDPLANLQANCGGALSVLEALRTSSSAAKLVFAGSRLIYGAASACPVEEEQPLKPTSPHGVHVATVERYLQVYAELHGIRSCSMRITNVYGPGQPAVRSAYGIVNHFIHLALAGRPLPVFGGGAQLRDFIFVDDVVWAMLLAATDERSDGLALNVGSGNGIQMIDAARLIVGVAGSGTIELRPWPLLPQQIDSQSFVADIGRCRDKLGWRPTTDFATGLNRTIALHRSRAAGY